MVKSKVAGITKRMLSLLLAFITVFTMLPSTILQASAASYRLATDEIDPAKSPGYTRSGSGYYRVASETAAATAFDNWGDIDGTWAVEELYAMVNQGVLYPVKSGSQKLLVFEELINGKDAMGIALAYFYPKNSNGYRVYQGASGTGFSARKDTFARAASYFDRATGASSADDSYRDVLDNIARKDSFTRKEAFLLIAFCIQQESGGAAKLTDYSMKKFGTMADNKTSMDCWDAETHTYKELGRPLVDWRDVQRYGNYYTQAANMLVDLGVLRGRDVGGEIRMEMDGTISYAEFISLLITLDNTGDEDGWHPTEYSDIDADLSVSAGDDTISYRDFLDGVNASLRVTLDASRTQSRQTITDYDFEVEDSLGNVDNNSGRNSSRTFTFDYSAHDMGFTQAEANRKKGETSYRVDFDGTVVVTDRLDTTEKASDSDRGTIEVVNYQPNAAFVTTTDSLSGGIYDQQFFYVGQPITISDRSSDYENALEEWRYTIIRNGSTIATANNFGDVTISGIGRSYIDAMTGSSASMTHSVTFSAAGTYVIQAYVIDEMGKRSDTVQQTIRVTGEPSPPTAIIEGNDYTYMNYNTTFTDASTDPNDDIVKWEWTEIWWFDEVLDEFDEGTGEGEWINVTDKVGGKDDPDAYWNGTRNNQTRTSSGSYSRATATLQFTKYGTYRIYEKVTDATGLTDTGYHDVTVLEDIPVIVVDPDPVPPQDGVKYTVTFINTDGSQKSVQVPAGTYVTADQVPSIIDKAGVYEHGWTQDGTKIVEPTTVKVNGNLTFVVYTTPEDENKTVHTVTFINTNGSTNTVKVPHNGNLTTNDVPSIINLPNFDEHGWTMDDKNVVIPTTVTIDRDMVFWVLKDPTEPVTHTIIFINTDGSTTVIKVPDGQAIPAGEVPDIIDMPGIVENGWTEDGATIVPDPSAVIPDRDMVFRVDSGPEADTTHTVTFINTDGTTTVVKVPDGEKIPLGKIPGIVDLPKLKENGWTPDGGDNVYTPEQVSGLPVEGDMVFRVDTDPAKDHTVIFVNTDGEVTVVEVPDGETVPPELVPPIKDLPEITENGWTENGGEDIVDPADIPITEDTIFVVDKNPVSETHTVIFINTDGTVTSVQVPDGGNLAPDTIPSIVDAPDLIENGWTEDGNIIYQPEDIPDIPITEDKIFHVDTEPVPATSHTVTFINTDGSVTTTVIPSGEAIPADDVPHIVDVNGVVERGWTDNGNQIVMPAGIIVNKDLVFWVKTEPEADDTVTVTFINTDGSKKVIEIPKGSNIASADVPDIIDIEDLIENGWTSDGENVVDPTKNPVEEDTVFWVDTDKVTSEYPEDGLPYYDGQGRLVIKQNRAALIDATKSLSPPNDPIQVDKTEWVLASVDGYDLGNVKFSGGKASGLSATFIAKEPGEFRVTITLHNNYSDKLAQDRPNSSKLEARTKTITVIVYPDEPPEASLFVNNANPNFHTNPKSTDITVASSATSPDGDIISKYEWTIVRDENNDGAFDEEPFYNKDGANLGTVTFPVEFQSGVVGEFLARLKVTESAGQTTLPEYIEPDDNLTAETEKRFEVNWTPCISYDLKLNGNAWAYVDDVIPISAKVLDENTSTCSVQWTLKKKTGGSYIAVDTSAYKVWEFGTLGGELLIPEDGYYVLEAVITDDHGYSETFVSNEIRIYDLPTAVISDTPEYRWMEQQWQYKQARRFDVNGNASYADDSTGKALHEIDHMRDVWSITPISDGASAEAIYVLDDDGKSRLMSEENTYFLASKNAFDERIAIIEPGTYQIGYQVTNTYGKRSEVVYQTITIVDDHEPIISTGTPATHVYLGSAADDAYVTIGMTNVHVNSDDMDLVGGSDNYVAQYRYDSDNDGDYEDEEWRDCDVNAEPNQGMTSLALSLTATVNQVGWYQFRLFVTESFGQPTLETIIPDDCYMSYEFFHEVEVDNSSPHGTFDVANTVYGDIIFAMGKSENVSEVSEKTQNFENSFGDVEGADVFQLDVQTIETSSVNLADGISWDTSQMSSSIGSVDTGSDGLTVEMQGNTRNAGQNIMFTTDYEGKIGFAFDYNLSFGDSFNGAGVVVNLADEGSQLKATVIWIPNGSMGMGQAGIYDIVYSKGSNSSETPTSYTRLQSFSLSTSGRLEIEVNAGTITVSGSGVNDKTYTVTTDYNGDGFGFYSSHYSHNCSQIGQFRMTNIQLEVTVQRSLADSMTDVSFNSNHDVFVIWTEDTISQELDKTSPTYEEDYAELLSLLVSQNIHLIILGSDENAKEMQALLDQCLVPGIFINEKTVDDDLEAARDFIASVLRQQSDTNVKYVLVNEETIYNKHYTDFNGHDHWYAGGYTTNEDGEQVGVDNILSSKWWYRHEPDYFLNPIGLYAQNEVWQPNEVTMFTETGRYFVNYKVKDNSVPDAYLDDNTTDNPFDEYRYWSNNYGNDEYDESGNLTNQYAEIYVHRRPVAAFDFIAHMSDTDELEGIDITNDAYDLDHYEAGNPESHPTRGLQQYEWTWQLAEDPTTLTSASFTDPDAGQKWINEQLASIAYDSTTNVLISYRVRDIDGIVHEEDVVYTHQIGAINGEAIYKAPDNSYHHTTLDKDLVVNGVVVAPAGTYVTTDYDEAVSELRAALADAERRLSEATADYNAKEATAQQADRDAAAAEQAADKAEADRDAKQAQVAAQEVIVASAQQALDTATKAVNSAKTALDKANANAQATLKAYNDAKAAYDSAAAGYEAKKAAYDAAMTKYNEQAKVQSGIQAEIDALNAKHEAQEVTDEDYAAQLAELNKRMDESKALQQKVNDEEVVPAKAAMDEAKTAMDNAKAGMDAAKTAYDTAKAAADTRKSEHDAAVSKQNDAQRTLDAAAERLETLRSEHTAMVKAASEARQNATTKRAESDAARRAADDAKDVVDRARDARDAAQKVLDDFTYLTNDQTVWATTTEKQEIPNGVWSFHNTVRVSGNPIPPVAKFVTNKIYYDIKEDINITDQSYSPNGNNITTWAWTITGGADKVEESITYTTLTKNGPAGSTVVKDVPEMQTLISERVTQIVNSHNLGMNNSENTYKITLVVTDDKSVPLQSDPYSVSIVVTPSNTAPTIDPNNTEAPDGSDDDDKNTSIYRKNTPIVYEYDPYDANQANRFYTYKGAVQYRGTETIDWTVILDDPDNHDNYGTANDTREYTLDYLFERFEHQDISTVLSSVTTSDQREYGPYVVTADEALINKNVAPFITVKDGGLTWGAYRITTTVTDNPLNGSAGKSASIVTNPDVVPKHLYVVPKLLLDNIHFMWEGVVDTEEQVPVGDTITVTFTTNAQTTSAAVIMPDGEGGEVKAGATLVRTEADGTKVWSADAVIPDTIEEDDLVDGKGYTFYVETNTTYGSPDGSTIMRTKRVEKSMNVLAIKLFNFTLTNVTDPAVKFDTTQPVGVPNLAFDDRGSNLDPADRQTRGFSITNQLMKKGYTFYFELYSMGLKGENDTVRITPKFYMQESGTGTWTQLDVYYKNKSGDYVLGTYDPDSATRADDTFVMYASGQSGSELGTMRALTLDGDDRTEAGKEQLWKGRYGLPSSALFVKKGQELTTNNLVTGDILIVFDIEAMKNGDSKYDYVGRGQWAAERHNDAGALINGAKSFYQDGAVIVLDGGHDAMDNYDSLPVWRKS